MKQGSIMNTERRLTVEITEQKSISTVYFTGIYSFLSITLIKEIIQALIRNQRYKLIFRFEDLTGLDQEAYDYLEWVQGEVSRLGGAVVLICPPDEPQDICNKLKKRYHFLVFPDFEKAREYFIQREF